MSDAKFICLSSDALGNVYIIAEGGLATVGRSKTCEIIIENAAMSAKHFHIIHRENGFNISDNNSTNGTFVNGERLKDEERLLHDGDIVQTGLVEFLFDTGDDDIHSTSATERTVVFNEQRVVQRIESMKGLSPFSDGTCRDGKERKQKKVNYVVSLTIAGLLVAAGIVFFILSKIFWMG